MDFRLTIYSAGGDARASVEKWKFFDGMMQEQYIMCTVRSDTPIPFAIGDYCEFRGEKYVLTYVPTAKQTGKSQASYDAYQYTDVKFGSIGDDELTRCMMLDITSSTSAWHEALGTNYTGSSVFNLFCGSTVATVSGRVVVRPSVCTLVAKIQANLDRMYGGGDDGWKIDVNTEQIATSDSVLSFNNTTAMAALAEVHNTFKLDYCIRGRHIYIGYDMTQVQEWGGPLTPYDFGYGRGFPTSGDARGLFEIERTADSNQQVVTRLRVLGSSKNLPYRYYNKRYQLSQALFPLQLQLPDTFRPYGSASTPDTKAYNNAHSRAGQGLRAVLGATNDAYIDKNDDAAGCPEGIREASVRFDGSDSNLDEIYPSIEGNTYDILRAAGVEDQDGNTGSGAFPHYDGSERIDDILVVEADANAGDGILQTDDTTVQDSPFHIVVKDMGFDIEACFNGDTPMVSVKSGECVGREFQIGSSIEKVTDPASGKKGYRLTLSRAKDDSLNTYYPNGTAGSGRLMAGDSFVLTGIDMPDAYVDMAEVRLLRAATDWLADNDETKFTYKPQIDEIYLRREYDRCDQDGHPENSILYRLYAGLKFPFRSIPDSEGSLLPYVSVTIEQVTINVGDGMTPKVEIKLNDDIQQSTIQKLTTSVDRIYQGLSPNVASMSALTNLANALNDMFTKEADGNGGYRIKANYGLYTNFFLSAGGLGTGGGGGGGGDVTLTLGSVTKTGSILAFTAAEMKTSLGSYATGWDNSISSLGARVTALENAPAGGVTSFNGRTGAITLLASDVPSLQISKISGLQSALDAKQPLITSTNKLDYSLISGTPTSLKNPYALSFGSKTYDGSSAKTITASDLGALTSHQTIYSLTIQKNGAAVGTYSPSTAAATINISVAADSMFTLETDSHGNQRIKANYPLYSEGYISAGGVGQGGGGGTGGGINTIYLGTVPYTVAHEGDTFITLPPYPTGGGGVWGNITGNISSQTDLMQAFNSKYDASNPAGFVTASALSSLESKLNDLFTKESDGAGGYRIRANYGLYTASFLSAGGLGTSGGGGGGVSSIYVNGHTYNPDQDGKVTLPDYPTSLLWSNISGKPTTLAGYGITDAGIANGVITLGANTITPATSAALAAHMADIGNPHNVTKSQVGLGNVENTALSTWTGSSNLTTCNRGSFGTVVTANTAMRILAQATTIPTCSAVYEFVNLAISRGNAASADKLSTARTIWGQSFDGTSNVAGALSGVTSITASGNVSIGGILELSSSIYLANNKSVCIADTSSNDINVLTLNASNDLSVGFGAASRGYDTYINGSNIYLRYGASLANGIVLSNAGNVGIGTQSPSYKLDVYGDIRMRDRLYIGQSGAYIEYDAVNSAFHFNRTVYSNGAISAGDINGSGAASSYTSYANAVRDTDHHEVATRRTSANIEFVDGGVHYFVASNSMTTGKPASTSGILHCAWDTGKYESQIAVPHTSSDSVQWRAQNAGTWFAWRTFYDDNNSNKTSVDWHAKNLVLSGTISGVTNITAQGSVGIGTTSPQEKLHVVGNIVATGQITPGYASDSRLKDNIEPLNDFAEILSSLRGVSFDWREEAAKHCITLRGHDVGMIAQDVQPFIPSAVSPIFGDYLRLDYTKIVPYLVEGWKGHESRIQRLENELSTILQRL